MKCTPELSIVIAVFNEDPRNLNKLLQRLLAAMEPTGLSYEAIFVDDGSNAQTNDALRHLIPEHNCVRLVVLSRNFGQQSAISAGIDHSSGRAVINIDSDCQDPPEMIPLMVEQWRKGYDVVYAQRLTRRDGIAKKLPAFLFYRLLGSISSVQIPWDTGDFRLMDRKVVNALRALPEKTRFLRGLIPWMGFRQTGVPIERDARELGHSTYTFKKLVILAIDGLLSFSSMPLYAVFIIGAILLGASTTLFAVWWLSAVGIMHVHFQDFNVINNTALLFALMMFTGVQLLGIGCVALYLAKVLDETRGRPAYIVAERMGFSEHDVRQTNVVFSQEQS